MAGLTAKKAGQMLRDNQANGRPLTTRQRGYFGMLRGGKLPTQMKSLGGKHRTIHTPFRDISHSAPSVKWSAGGKFGNEL